MKKHKLKAIRKRWNRMDKQIREAAERRTPDDKPTKGMRRFGLAAQRDAKRRGNKP